MIMIRVRGCNGKLVNFGTIELGPENRDYDSNSVCEDGSKI
jgi:hypothetical protein